MVKVYGIPESMLAERLIPWEDALPQGIGLAYLPSPDVVKLRVTAKGKRIEELDNYYSNLLENLKGLYFTEGEDSSVEKVVGELLRKKGYTLATAESCTGGYIAHLITSIAGSSNYFKGSVVAYSNEVKENILGVNKVDLEQYGAVSEEVVMQMAEGIKRLTDADCVIATSGIAGPGGGTAEKPVGTVWIAIVTPKTKYARKYNFSFTRERNIAKAAVKALELIAEDIL
ncbi:MAG: nicotinamide-nucleotide amidohydrolase family protein [Odoribacter sp.]|nr:nicotinamide-nucleotide amidohydrolase family protein [Odoribacter sp.]